jgi:hypothetical protein
MLAMPLSIILLTIQIQPQAKKTVQKRAMENMKKIPKTVVRFGRDDMTMIMMRRCRMGRRAPVPVKRRTEMRNIVMMMELSIQKTKTIINLPR